MSHARMRSGIASSNWPLLVRMVASKPTSVARSTWFAPSTCSRMLSACVHMSMAASYLREGQGQRER